MKLKSLILLSSVCAWMLVSCNNASNNNNNEYGNNNNDTAATAPNMSTMDTSAVNANSNMNANTNDNNNSNGKVSADAADFMREAASGGMMEVSLGHLAQTNSTSADIKSFGQMLVKDHSAANAKLMAIAKDKGVTLPDTMMPKHQDMYNDLAKLKGKDFDQKFTSQSVDMHQKDIDKFNSEAKDITDTDLLTWIKNTLPVIEKHHTRAMQLDKKYNK